MRMSISYRRQRFYREYLATGGNGSLAARNVGCPANSAGQQAYEMLNDPEGQKFLMELTVELDKHLLMTAADVKNELALLASSNVMTIFSSVHNFHSFNSVKIEVLNVMIGKSVEIGIYIYNASFAFRFINSNIIDPTLITLEYPYLSITIFLTNFTILGYIIWIGYTTNT